ncbi:GntR family transcriptional regulator [Methylobacterium sp. WL103]|uniref:GntR family transcriptional regulator n=1 Tax=unclassified Methylobacterium TaxID=2615210 RepID=UPI0011CB11CA|nr:MULTISPECIES: GntR family transcriptional regulator [unclassified Methylobacterium]TXM70450.1 GntR family transcriptional regulator [Methylobacterium sp. WL120]TXM74221.1 GntR family transcriptional regulator [Methylobacterium sp. WL12]TXM93362.1 GntR family transcriptional regulator [Methylobacterium sp. WL103]
MNKIDPGLGISRRYLHDEVADRIRALIQSGEMEPKARVNEGELTERFGISRTPLREAIKILATEGHLELLPNRGARVASLSQVEIEEMMEVIAGLEATAADLACRTVTDDEVAAIQADHDAMVAMWKASDEAGYFRLNRQIHEAIMAASRNATLSGIYRSLSGRIQRSRYSAHQTPEQWTRAIEEHERMVQLLRGRDGPALSHLMREHIRGKKPVIAANFGDAAADLPADAAG